MHKLHRLVALVDLRVLPRLELSALMAALLSRMDLCRLAAPARLSKVRHHPAIQQVVLRAQVGLHVLFLHRQANVRPLVELTYQKAQQQNCQKKRKMIATGLI